MDTTASVLVLTSDCFLLVVTWMKTVGIRKNSMRLGLHTPLLSLLLRDGMSLSKNIHLKTDTTIPGLGTLYFA